MDKRTLKETEVLDRDGGEGLPSPPKGSKFYAPYTTISKLGRNGTNISRYQHCHSY